MSVQWMAMMQFPVAVCTSENGWGSAWDSTCVDSAQTHSHVVCVCVCVSVWIGQRVTVVEHDISNKAAW